eukprot:4218457-Pyramimonas_sp.AAC.1
MAGGSMQAVAQGTAGVALCRYRRGCAAHARQQEALDTTVGALGVVSLSVSGSQSVAGVALPRHHRGCAGGGLPIRFGLAKRGR